MGLEGQLAIRLGRTGDRVGRVEFCSSRLLEPTQALAGKPLDEALRALPLLYSICSTAHSLAGLEAAEAALGAAVDDGQRAARRLLALGEAADNHAWQLCLDWPRLLGEPPDPEGLKAVRAATAGLGAPCFGGQRWLKAGGVAAQPDRPGLVRAASALGVALARLGVEALPGGLDGLLAWARRGGSVAARLVDRLATGGEPGAWPAARLLPPLSAAWLLARQDDPELARRPTWEGAPAETGALARHAAHPLVAAAAARFGAGTLSRVLARLVDLQSMPAELARLAAGLTELRPAPVRAGGSGAGVAVVETSRGQLAHLVQLEGGSVVRWRTVAPTEWNFHPQGALAQGLTGSAAAGAEQRAAWMVAALDPCVACDVRWLDGEG